MNKLCAYTCITGNYDNLHEIENPEKNVDYYCFTNNKSIKSKTWKIIYIEDASLDNCRLARKIKTVGHEIIDSYEIAVWTDADIIWKKKISDFVKENLKSASFASFKHCIRNSVHEEAAACLLLGKDSKEIIKKTLDYYDNHTDYKDDNGLYESTVFIKKPKDPKVTETMAIWFDMIKNYSRRDQLSFTYAIWKTGLSVATIPGIVWNNEWFTYVKHAPSKSIETCNIYFGDSNKELIYDNYNSLKYKKDGNLYSVSTTIPCNTNIIEINPTNIIGIEFKDPTISPAPSKIIFYGAFTYSKGDAFCSSHNKITIKGNFKKGEKLSFSIILAPLDEADTSTLIEQLWSQRNSLNNENQTLINQNSIMKQDLENIKNSKSFKITNSLHKFKNKLFRH